MDLLQLNNLKVSMMKKVYYIFLLMIGLMSCQKKQVDDKSQIFHKEPSPKEEIEKLLPHIVVSEDKNSNNAGINECKIELSVGSSVEKIDSFVPSYIERKMLMYCDLAKNPKILEENSMVVFSELKQSYPKKYGELLNMSFATTVEERLYIPINRYCIFLNDSFITVTRDVVNEWDASQKDTVKDFEIVFKKSLSSIINEAKKPPTNNLEEATTPNNLKQFKEVELMLTDASIKKAKLYLGEPDIHKYGFGHETKGFAVYFNKVSNNGKPKNLVLFLRIKGSSWGNDTMIEEIYAVDEKEKACFGIHCIAIKSQKIYTNALDLLYDEGYESFDKM